MLLVSCCNIRPGLYLVDEDLEGYEKLTDDESRGFVFWGGFLYIACGASQKKIRGIRILDNTFKTLRVYPMNRDWHGLFLRRRTLYAVDRGNKSVWTFNWWLQDKKQLDLSLPPNSLNDIYVRRDGEIILLAWNGFIRYKKSYNAPQETTLRPNLQTHSIIKADKRFWWCNSQEKTIVSFSNEFSDEKKFATLDGYTRGLLVEKDHVFCGLSRNRKQEGARHHATVVKLNKSSKEVVKTLDLPSDEIYQISSIPDGWC